MSKIFLFLDKELVISGVYIIICIINTLIQRTDISVFITDRKGKRQKDNHEEIHS